MKAVSYMACAIMLCASTIALVRAEARQQAAPKPDARQLPAQLAFDRLKTLAGNWKGHSVAGTDNDPVRVLWRVTSGGAALLLEMVPEGRSDDPSNGADDPITMFYIDDGRLLLTHYCDAAKNRPRMTGKMSADGKIVEFDFLDVSGGTASGYMSHGVFTFIDADHHTIDWTYTSPAGQPVGRAHIDLVRAK